MGIAIFLGRAVPDVNATRLRGRIATKTYEADAIFPEASENSEVYGGMGVTRELARLLSTNGSELSIVAYGQTGTGKTYTTTSIEGERKHLAWAPVSGCADMLCRTTS